VGSAHVPENPERVYFTRNLFLERKALPTTFLPSVKTLTKNIPFVFLLAQVFFFVKRKSVASSSCVNQWNLVVFTLTILY
jgi:hypothetical protein